WTWLPTMNGETTVDIHSDKLDEILHTNLDLTCIMVIFSKIEGFPPAKIALSSWIVILDGIHPVN
ncbi:hypothetical protein, partial [Paenibacillus paridis]|uniref:hypothetical protein n=1 Tax=Paenibacillus paridis TaxID=2583376 RepID=UPI001EE4D6D6